MSALQASAAALRARAMTVVDLERVMEIETAVYPFPWTRGNFSDSLKAGHDAWVFESAAGAPAGIVGYAIVMWLPDEIHLLNISVDAAFQGRRHGRAMLDWLCGDARARGARSILLEVRPSNAAARALYAARGFAQVGLRRGYYPAADGAREDALVLRRELGRG
ncbi:ribosomal protein S18-alanine N-acetyltransferase [Quisquiliibacterium transsilvanicum]|uniref:[Ribosomal protein bS18]-alanine N-acetyltransferase n=1 Tax=Quisquiliibacterium transsilvanicum TaxID=1549638 RepID=A0A7W8HG44_9BURK|nr:ribosomal-protein-alanine N-acetyltransferase [Quisquiliibacterium transsilvanicum]